MLLLLCIPLVMWCTLVVSPKDRLIVEQLFVDGDEFGFGNVGGALLIIAVAC